jgi:hypothetical protein
VGEFGEDIRFVRLAYNNHRAVPHHSSNEFPNRFEANRSQ